MMLTAATAGALLVNKALIDRETRPAHADGGRVLDADHGGLHVREEGAAGAPPLLLVHGFAGSMHWFDRLVPLLADGWRVIRVNLLGHGGSPCPKDGYALENQARLVGLACDALGVEGAVVVGHSMGAAVSVSLAEQRPELVRALALLDEGPDDSFATTPLMTKLGFVPVVGELMHRLALDPLVRDGYGDAFAKGFDLATGFAEPDQVVRDFRNMTYTSYSSSWAAEQAFLAAGRLDARVSRLGITTLVAFGTEDGFFRAPDSAQAFRAEGVRVEMLEDVGHSPAVEAPERVAALVGELAAASAAVG
jgi:pimeloyl-ACP methyl ester carboxylesterase